MSEARLKFWNDGKPFEPKVYPEDVAAYAQKEGDLMRPVQAAREAVRDADALVLDLKEGKAKHVQVAQAQKDRDKAFQAFLAADEAAKGPVLALQSDFITAALKREDPPLKKTMKLTVAEIRGGFNELWNAAHDWRKEEPEPRPLGNGGGTSAPSPSPA